MDINQIDKLLSNDLEKSFANAEKLILQIRTELQKQHLSLKSLDALELILTDCHCQLDQIAGFWRSNRALTTKDFVRLLQILQSQVSSNLEFLKEDEKRRLKEPENPNENDYDRLIRHQQKQFRIEMMINTKILGDFLLMLEKLKPE